MKKLKERITENGIDYILTGEYYIPNLVIEDEGYMIGRWGAYALGLFPKEASGDI